jgi:propane monooxygenase reductase subunit
MANRPGDGHIELIMKRYAGGRFSSLELKPGDEMRFTGPYGSFHLRHSSRPILMIAGGSGMAPILSLLRHLSAERTERMVRFFYGARHFRDLFYLDFIQQLGAEISDFRFTPVLSDADSDDEWSEELPLGLGFVHEVAGQYLASGEMSEPESYMCGPPPMIDAATELLVEGHGIDENSIFADKFTLSADAEDAADDPLIGHRSYRSRRSVRSPGPPGASPPTSGPGLVQPAWT